MTKTIDDIKGMNLKVGDKIELTLINPKTNREISPKMGYIESFDEGREMLICINGGEHYAKNIYEIKDIKILDYKKQIQPERSEDELTR